MLTSNTHQQSLADADSETRPRMLERGSYIPWASRFRRYLNRKRKNRKSLNKAIDEGLYEFKEFTPSETEEPRMQKQEDLRGDDLKHFEVEIEAMNLILISIPNDIYNFVDACTTAQAMWQRVKRLMRAMVQNKVDMETRFNNEFDQFVIEPGEALVSVYNRFAQLMNDLERNGNIFPKVTVNTKFLNCLQPEWLKYVTQVRLVKRLTEDTYDDLFDYLQQFRNWNFGDDGRNTRHSYVQEEVIEGTNVQNDAGNIQELFELRLQKLLQMFNATTAEEAGAILTDEQNDFLFGNASRMEEIKELSANICLMARIQLTNFDSDAGPSYDSVFLSEVQTPSTNYVNPIFAKDKQDQKGDDEVEKILRDSIEIQEGMQKRINILENDVQRCQKQSLDFELQLQHEKERQKCESSLKNVCETSWISKMEKLEKSSEIVDVSVRTNKKKYVASKNVVLNKKIVTDVDVQNDLKAKNVLCVSCAKNVLIPCHDKCLANYKLNVHSKVKRALFTTHRTAKSMFEDTTPVVSKTRFSVKTTQSESLDTTSVASRTNIAVVTPLRARNKVVQIVLWIVDRGCSNHMTGDCSLLKNFVKKSMGTVRFGNDHFAAITGCGDYVQGNITICHVYYVEGLGHNLFSVGQFCDGDLEVAFRSNTCYVRNLEGDDLLTRARDSNLYTISISDMAASLPVCLLSEATSTNSWLWHRRLSHLNFGTINDLTKHDLVDSLPKFKYSKDHLCSASMNTPSKEDLDNLFGPMYDEYFEKRSSDMSINSVAQQVHNHEDSPSTSSIIIEEHEAPPIVNTSEEQTSPISLNEADEFS
ncbi:integrase, catalytic region, zinc finger, CCHC-type containing protein [Tanacetum coccineum]|uniref:Integrase, catalytic region, zinc finger, CCHC-type containing protein n=1 Tax=Tanacetum coccineum TaxID=301880 RepID=A0ABQ4ZYQ7_9ASTR